MCRVPGIGPKNAAAQLIEEFGDLDTLLERASEIKQNKRRENIIEFADKARISRELVRLKDRCRRHRKARRAGAQSTRRAQACCLPQGHGIHLADAACGRSHRDRCQTRSTRPKWPWTPRLRCAGPISIRAGKGAGHRPGTRKAATTHRRAWPSGARKLRPRRRSTHRPMKHCAISTSSRPGAPWHANAASSPSTPKPPRSTQCRRSWWVSRWRFRKPRPTPAI
jgi:hypothetical protein